MGGRTSQYCTHNLQNVVVILVSRDIFPLLIIVDVIVINKRWESEEKNANAVPSLALIQKEKKVFLFIPI